MTKYDIMYEALQSKVVSGELTVETAEYLNDVAFEMYSKEEVKEDTFTEGQVNHLNGSVIIPPYSPSGSDTMYSGKSGMPVPVVKSEIVVYDEKGKKKKININPAAAAAIGGAAAVGVGALTYKGVKKLKDNKVKKDVIKQQIKELEVKRDMAKSNKRKLELAKQIEELKASI